MDENIHKLALIIGENLNSIEQIVLSRPCDPQILKSRATPVLLKGERAFALETFGAQNNVYHKNISADEAPEFFSELALTKFRQANIITTAGECSVMVSKKGKVTLLNKIKKAPEGAAVSAELSSHNRQNYSRS